MNKLFTTVLLLFVIGIFSACSSSEDSSGTSDNQGSDTTEQQKSEDQSSDEGNKEASDDKENGQESGQENSQENSQANKFGKLTVHKQKKELNETFESGPMILTINAIQSATLEISEDFKDYFDGKDKVTLITVNMKAENTSEDTIGFYPDQSILVTDAGDQVETDLFLSDNIGGDFYGKVRKEGDVIFQLDTPADEINTIKLIVFGPHDEDFNSLSDDLQIELSF